MELLILMVALALWVLQKVLSSSNKEGPSGEKGPPPIWRIRTDGSPFRIFGSTPTEFRTTSPSAAGPQENIQRIAKKSKKRKNEGCSGGGLGRKNGENLKNLQPRFGLKGRKGPTAGEGRLQGSLVQGIYYEILSPPSPLFSGCIAAIHRHGRQSTGSVALLGE